MVLVCWCLGSGSVGSCVDVDWLWCVGCYGMLDILVW